jgi:low affinity Fe/Cu permease
MGLGWLAAVVGQRAAKPVFFGLLAVLLLGTMFLLGKCSNDDDEIAAQVEQTNRSGEAVANAAEMAIDKLEDRTVTDQAIDQAVASTTQEIGRAETADAVRAAVIAGVCDEPEHRHDPACRVR